MTSRQQAWQARKKAKGLCITCGRRKANGMQRCRICSKKDVERKRKARMKP